MADVKISGLPASTVPLAGTEVLPIVQGGVTKKVAVSDLTAGRAVSAASLALTGSALPVGSGGSGTSTAFTAGSVVFAGTSGVYSQNNANFFWDNTNVRLGIGNAAPDTRLHLTQPNNTAPAIRITNSSGRSNELGYTGQFEFSLGANFGNDNVRYGIFTSGGGVATIWTNNLERVRVFSTGGVSIGDTTDPGAGALRITDNLVIGTSGKGIDFSATPGTGTSELFNDYEEGAWTPTDASGDGLTLVAANGFYTKIGRVVYWQAVVVYPSTASATDSLIGGLPFTVVGGTTGQGRSGAFISVTDKSSLVNVMQIEGTTTIRPYKASFVRATNADLSTGNIYFAGFFIV